jgi:undecaprenyl-diphosphatase
MLFSTVLLAGLFASGFALLGLAEFHEEIAEPFLINMDRTVQEVVHEETSSLLTRVMFVLTWVGSPEVLFPAVPLVAALFWWRKLRREGLVLLVAMVGAASLNTALKLYFRRARPDPSWGLVQERSFSFPSGHSVSAVVLYGILVYLGMRHLHTLAQRIALIVVALVLIVGIGVSRIYLGAHYPSDVLAGYFVGCIWLITVMGADWFLRSERKPIR